MTMLGYREAARRVRRSVLTIKRWRRHGMPMGWERRSGQDVRVVREDVLLAWWRARMSADPVYQQKVRARLAALAAAGGAAVDGADAADSVDLPIHRV